MICSGVHPAAASAAVEVGTVVDAASVVGAVDASGSACSIVASWRRTSCGCVGPHKIAPFAVQNHLLKVCRNHWVSKRAMLMDATPTRGDRNRSCEAKTEQSIVWLDSNRQR